MINTSIQKKELPGFLFLIITIGLFFFPRSIRLGLVGSKLGSYNVLAILGTLLIIFRKKFFIFKTVLLFILMFGITVLTEIKAGIGTPAMILTLFLNLIMPMFMLYMDDIPDMEKWLSRIITVFNCAIVITFACSVFDILLGREIGRAVANFSKDDFYMLLAKSNKGRLFTWYGHFLCSAEYFLAFDFINVVYYRVIKKQNEPIYIHFISLLAVLLVASKSALFILLVSYCLLNINKAKNMILACFFISIIYAIGGFDLVLERLLRIDISTGRNEALTYLISHANLFPVLIGNGTNYISILRNDYSNASAGLEYVVFSFTAYFGIVFTFLFYMVSCIKPLILAIKTENRVVVITLVALITFINSYNGLALFQDLMWIYCWIIAVYYMIIKISNSNKRESLIRC